MELLVFKAKDNTSFRLSTKYGNIIVPSYFKDCNGYSKDIMNILRTHPNVEIKAKVSEVVIPVQPKTKLVGFTLTPDVENIELTVGKDKSFLVNPKPSSAELKNLKVFIADKKIAKVSSTQPITITGNKQGNTILTLASEGITKEITVLVYDTPKFKQEFVDCFVGDSVTFELTNQYDFVFTSENPDYSVEGKQVTFNKSGEYILSTTVRDEEISVVVTVKEKDNEHTS